MQATIGSLLNLDNLFLIHIVTSKNMFPINQFSPQLHQRRPQHAQKKLTRFWDIF